MSCLDEIIHIFTMLPIFPPILELNYHSLGSPTFFCYLTLLKVVVIELGSIFRIYFLFIGLSFYNTSIQGDFVIDFFV